MAKLHWTIENTPDVRGGYGCQHSNCLNVATWQWQREATELEVQAEHNSTGRFGEVHRNPQGPHNTAVFACEDHRLEFDTMALRHKQDCPAPDPGCECA